MSLINEALKKAQRQRTEGSEPEPLVTDAGATPAQRVARREKPAGFRSQMMMAVGGGVAALILVLAIGGIWYWRSNRKPEVVPAKTEVAATAPVAAPVKPPVAVTANPNPATTTPASTPAPAAAAVTPPPVVETKPAPTVAIETTKVAPPPAASGQVQFTLPLSAPPAATTAQSAPAITLPLATETARPAERPKAPPHMVTIIENLRVAGIRAAGEDSKVLMNDRVYRLNDMVDRDLGIRLTGVSAKSLTFEDDHGAVYTRNF